jgi:hypothetical protein
MTNYQDDPNLNRRRSIDYGERSNTGTWVAGAVGLAIVLGILGYAASTRDTNVAENRPAATERSTTGSGTTTPPATTQQKPATAPAATTGQNAPAPPPATNR